MAEVRLWLWTITDPVTGRRRQKVEGSLEVRHPDPRQSTNFLGPVKKP
jgi:hypothetical protein